MPATIDFCCPKCRKKLSLSGNSYMCSSGHVYDRAREGYVNLLISNTSSHGDDIKMIGSRRDFLNLGHYESMRSELSGLLKKHVGEYSAILDCGCGEGYYTEKIHTSFPNGKVYGIDVSKTAVKACAKRIKSGNFAVASAYDLPFEENSFDAVVSVFSPFAKDEFSRILNKDGKILSVFPLENHLIELKTTIYDNPYPNSVSPLQIDGFKLLDYSELKYEFCLDSNSSIKNLFAMTPYYYRTSVEDRNKLEAIEFLKLQAQFGLAVYLKS